MIHHRLLLAAAAASLVVAGSAAGASVAANFHHADFDANTGVNPGENTATLDGLAGLTDPAWTNLAINGAGGASAGSGSVAGISVTWHSANAWQAGSEGLVTATSDASQQPFRMYLDDGDGGNSYFNGDGYGVTVQISGIAAFLASQSASSYNLTLLFSTDSSGFVTGQVRSGNLPATPSATAVSDLGLLGTIDATIIGNGIAPFTDPVPDGAQSNTQGTRGVGTLTGLTDDAITIAMPVNAGGGVRGSLAGFAITPVPEPSTSLLGLVGTALLLGRRRR